MTPDALTATPEAARAAGEPSGPEAVLSLCENHQARDLIAQVWRVVEVWDDAIDRDGSEDNDTISAAFEWLLFGLPRNTFYRDHPALQSALFVAVGNWHCANRLEAIGTRKALVPAYTLRCSVYDFFVAVVLADAGPLAARQAAMRLHLSIDGDPFDDYLNEHLKES